MAHLRIEHDDPRGWMVSPAACGRALHPGKKMGNIEYLARGICFVDGYVLLAHCIGAANTFLPGGHIDFGEKAPDCLSREIEEELALENTVVDRFLGAVEHKWEESGVDHHEINLVFELRLSGTGPPTPPVSREGHLEFLWAKPNELARHNLKPSPLIDYICNHMQDERPYWGSTL
jgi:8-oxo-dGTP diphosphatase